MIELMPDNEKEGLIKKLNTCYNQFSQWGIRKAQKNHVDIFGVEIKEGDYYYRMRLDLDYSNDLKLSIISMVRFLYAIYAPNPSWGIKAEKIIKDKFEKTRELIDNCFEVSRKMK